MDRNYRNIFSIISEVCNVISIINYLNPKDTAIRKLNTTILLINQYYPNFVRHQVSPCNVNAGILGVCQAVRGSQYVGRAQRPGDARQRDVHQAGRPAALHSLHVQDSGRQRLRAEQAWQGYLLRGDASGR